MRQLNILVVDDEYRIRRLLSEFLVRENYKVVEAEDGEQALQIIFGGKPKIDLVVLDVMMPKYSGWFVLERIREVSSIPVIMLTAKSDEVDQLKGFKLGADDYVTKPFSPSVLMARINKLVKKELEEDKPIIIVMHIPISTKYNENEMKKFDPYFVIYENDTDETTKEFINILVSNDNIKAILCGHTHGHLESYFAPNKLQCCASSGLIGLVNKIIIK